MHQLIQQLITWRSTACASDTAPASPLRLPYKLQLKVYSIMDYKFYNFLSTY